MDFKGLLKKEFVILDGAMGTMLQKSGLPLGEIPEILNITHKEQITDIHRQYINAGADIVYANTFGANRYKLKDSGYTPQDIIPQAVENAKKAAENTDVLVALDIGPIGQLLEPAGALSFEEAYDIFKEQVIAGKNADVIVFETMSDLLEIKAAVLAAKENSDKPVICTMSFEENMRTFTGVSVSSMAITLSGLGADAIGVNCSLGPDELLPIVKEMSLWTDLPLVVKPNAGLPDPNSNTYNVGPKDFTKSVLKMLDCGVKLAGGCCGTSPEYISELAKALKNEKFRKNTSKKETAVCSPTSTVVINQPRIIGERINPTGKKLFKEALKNNDMNYILNQAVSQVKGGADILDVNVGLPEIDEKSMMVSTIKALQSVVDVPLQIDSTKPEVIEAGLRVYNGKPIINSVNGEDKSLDAILPLVKKYGASVVGLTLDENGIPKTAQGRFEIAQKIVERAEKYGIPKSDVYIDCLTLTASAEQQGVSETLTALHRVKTELGCKTVLGVSNISFGLPNRELVNRTFLTMALQEGLDLPIINPNVESMTGAVRAYKVLANIDENSRSFIEAYNEYTPAKAVSPAEKTDLDYAIINGLKEDGARACESLLEKTDPMEIINNRLIPALDKVGDDFEKGKIFLPQLIQSANTAQACFDVIKKKLTAENNTPVSKGKIILATVKGDIHDIGKNIVKVLLDNYGYTVVDLGKDVDPQLVVDTAIEQNIKMIGLSALMTTTLKSMEDTIALIRNTKELQNPDGSSKCVVFVGGAVLTEEYAVKIGADYYCRDAKESVDTAKKVLG
ncbi:MAG: homocysteine S-methyltransferase family protein [Oscillospiraceae bacterium]|nr:homocysteine S-methyltransferase family protein [Oscillospiraceae bacterium]